jgi:hypothetical protein
MVMEQINWDKLHFGSLTREEIREAVLDTSWQRYRLAMIGHTLQYKYRMLVWWLNRPSAIPLRTRQVQITNYINALKRGGLI